MKYNLGEEVYYKGKKFLVESCREFVETSFSCGKEPAKISNIYYDIYNTEEDTYNMNISEDELLKEKEIWSIEYIYILRNGLEMGYDDEFDFLFSKKGLIIPLSYYEDMDSTINKCLDIIKIKKGELK